MSSLHCWKVESWMLHELIHGIKENKGSFLSEIPRTMHNSVQVK